MAATDSAVLQLREEWDLTGKFVVAYSGNLGRVHDLTPVLEAGRGLLAGSPIKVAIAFAALAVAAAVLSVFARRGLASAEGAG